jgi:aminopeptidase
LFDERLEKLANVLVNYSTKVKKNDKVFIKSEEIATPFTIAVAEAAIKKGALVEYNIELPEIEELILKFGDKDQIEYPGQHYGRAVCEGDVWITSWGSKNSRTLYNIDLEILKKRRLSNKEHKKIYVDRCASGDLRWVGTTFPTNAEAQEANMSLSEYEDFVFNAGMLNYQDPISEWKKIGEIQQRWCEYLNTKKELKIIKDNINLTVGIENRKWINCCGEQNFPDGEIFTSPIEDSINGEIFFDYPIIFQYNIIKDIKLKILNGKIIDAHVGSGESFFNSCLELDEGSKFFGEVAIGTNYNIKKFTKNILFDEKIGGTIHMALGCGFPEAGGKNFSSIHLDMITSMNNSGKIFADDELFYCDGKFIDKVLKK